MPYLSRDLRRSLESTIKTARVTAEAGAADALRRLGVGAASCLRISKAVAATATGYAPTRARLAIAC